MAAAVALSAQQTDPLTAADAAARDILAGSRIAVPARPDIPGSPLAALKPGDWGTYLSYLESATGTKSAGKNSIEFFVDKQIIAPATAAVNGAKASIHIEVYQFQADQVGQAFAQMLADKAVQGVRVRLLLDAFGSKTNHPAVQKLIGFMRQKGVAVLVRPNPVLDGHLDHRKVMVIDGTIGFTGGMNIGAHYQEEWHDQQTLLQGPAVAKLQEAFLSQWNAVGGTVAASEDLFPALAPQPDGYETRVVAHLGGDQDENIKLAYLGAITTAQKLIHIADPYFADADIIAALEAAARRGVQVKVELPAVNNEKIVQCAARGYYPDMIAAGVQVYEYPGRMAHEKVAVMDDFWTTFGSSNLDARSLKNNDELNVIVTDARFAAVVESALFDPDFKQCKRILHYTPTPADIAARAESGVLVPSPEDVPGLVEKS